MLVNEEFLLTGLLGVAFAIVMLLTVLILEVLLTEIRLFVEILLSAILLLAVVPEVTLRGVAIRDVGLLFLLFSIAPLNSVQLKAVLRDTEL